MVALPAAAERHDGYFDIVDETGASVYQTGRKIQTGDQFLTENNKRYEIISIDQDTAQARLIGQVDLSAYLPQQPGFFARLFSTSVPTAGAEAKKIAIYHTHSDESYVSSDGSDSKYGAGGIYKVGEAFAEGLKKNGLIPIMSMSKHDPHDDMAYQRSRRTAAQLIKNEQPAAIFDIHRDAVPPKVYGGTINGKDISKVQLVVGKYGPTGKQIEEYAMRIKASADKKYPGLVKGIFFAKGGDYNQDLHPRSMLVEAGAHTNSRESAERGISMFADVMPTVLGVTGNTAANPDGAADLGSKAAGLSGASKSIGWILAVFIIGTIAFLILSTGSVKGAKDKAKQFFTTEFTNFLGPLRKKKPQDDDDRDQQK